jgi:hypothetical protein
MGKLATQSSCIKERRHAVKSKIIQVDADEERPMPRRILVNTALIAMTLLAACDWGDQSVPAAYRSSPAGKQVINNSGELNFKPGDGYVPDAKTAIKTAVAVWEPIYGEKQIAGEKPYHAQLTDGVWTVEGSLPDGWDGGVAIAQIAKSDGRVLLVIHGK